jgi:transposase
VKIWYDKKSKDPSYFVQQGIRNGKKVTTKNIFKIGKHSELLAQGHADPLAYAKEVVEEYNKKMKSEKVDLEITIDFNKKLIPSDNVSSKSSLLNIGYFFLQDIYSKLNLKDFIKNITKDKKITYNLNDIARFSTFDRILNPKSKLATVNNLEFFYEKPSFSHQNVLRGMDILANNYDAYLNHLYQNSENVVKRDTSVCYYDCTNYYFEIENEDSDYIDEVTGEVMPGFRKYGPSKEHRPNPIVEMGLFMDKNGIPLSMGLYPGNTNEQKTVNELETKLIKQLKNKKIIYCADAGLGSASIRALNDMAGRAFIVTQSIKKLSEELQKEVFEDRNYKLLSNDSKTTLDHMKSFDRFDENNLSLYNDKAYKVIDVDSNVDLGLFEEKKLQNGKTKIVKSKAILKQRIIITYSRKMAEYQKNIRNKQIERAKYLISKGVDDIRKGPNDIARFIKSETKNVYSLDLDRIANEEKYDGFYALATNLEDESIKEIIEINAQRYKIEDCFRTLKTNFDARPIYHRLEPRIIAHFMICYTALLIYRLLENKLKEKGYHFTINEILNTLKNMNVSNRDGLFYEAEFTSSKVCTALNDLFNFGLDKKYYQNSELTKLVKKI